MTSIAAALPEHSNDGYVAAAYIVFLAIVLIYVAIMAVRLGRVERKVEELRSENQGGPTRARESAFGEGPSAPDRPHPDDARQEHTLKGAGETV